MCKISSGLLMLFLIIQLSGKVENAYAESASERRKNTINESNTLDCGRSEFVEKHKEETRRHSDLWFYKRIVGGISSEEGEWPWLVTMMLTVNGSQYEHMCGGTLIHPQWILTAAHCFEDVWADFLTDNPSSWLARLGEHNLFEEHEPHIDAPLEKIIIHPRRQAPWTFNRDVALVKLARPVKLSARVNIACLPQANHFLASASSVVAAGWGHTSEDGILSDVVKHVHLPVIGNMFCNILYRKVPQLAMLRVTPDMMCAGSLKGGRDSCQYDSGGPLMHYDMENGRWTLVGIVMTGLGCGRPGFPGMYTRVSYFANWINDTVAAE